MYQAYRRKEFNSAFGEVWNINFNYPPYFICAFLGDISHQVHFTRKREEQYIATFVTYRFSQCMNFRELDHLKSHKLHITFFYKFY